MSAFHRFLVLVSSALLAAAPCSFASESKRVKPTLDVKKIVNASYHFKQSEEPQMASDEYAVYEKVVGMLTLNREFAMKLLETMVTAKSDATPAFLFVMGNVYFTDNQTELAEDHYRRAIQLLPTFTRAWANLGNLLFTQGKYEEATVCFTKVTATGERDVQTLSLLAYCLDRTGRKLGAEMNYIQALGLDPDHLDSLRGLMSLSLDTGQLARAEELLKQLIRLAPSDRQAWSTYGTLLISQERHVEAIGLLESAAALDLLDSDGLILLCDLYISQGFRAEIQHAFQRLREKDPAMVASRRLHHVQALVSERDFVTAERELALLTETAPPDKRLELIAAEAGLRLAQSRWSDARRLYEKILQSEPLRGEALIGLGTALKALGEAAAAELVFDRAAQLPPFAYRAYFELADSALRHRLYSRALNFLERAAAIQKSPPLDSYIARIRLLITNHENK